MVDQDRRLGRFAALVAVTTLLSGCAAPTEAIVVDCQNGPFSGEKTLSVSNEEYATFLARRRSDHYAVGVRVNVSEEGKSLGGVRTSITDIQFLTENSEILTTPEAKFTIDWTNGKSQDIFHAKVDCIAPPTIS